MTRDRRNMNRLTVMIVLVISVLIAACGDERVPSPVYPESATLAPNGTTLTITGNLPDGCSALAPATVQVSGPSTPVNVKLTATRPKDGACTAALQPFTTSVELKEPLGNRSVTVNGVPIPLQP